MIGEMVAMEKAQKSAKWFQCKKCICSFMIEERKLNFCPQCGLRMKVEISKKLDDKKFGSDEG